MKVIIDLIEDIRVGINNDKEFSLVVMGLQEKENGEFTPSWESRVCSMKLDEKTKRFFLLLGKEEGISSGELLNNFDTMSNEEMMYEVCISYSKGGQRLDSSLIGFGESLEDKRYLLFIAV